ncbi:MAG: hypothetical protein KF784_11340 [Fimbriimonadaceae bacterium]|nr:hypothetical protein [Fimbriimonadaceae bacterium]
MTHQLVDLFAFDLQGDEILGLVLGFVMFMIPIVYILTKHQQKMAELLNRNSSSQDPQVLALAAQVERLTQALHSQTLAVDELSQKLNTLPPPAPKTTEETPKTYLVNE